MTEIDEPVTHEEHQLHIVIPKSLHEEVKVLLPNYGAITSLVRNFLKGFIHEYKKASSILEKSPFDKVTIRLAKENALKRSGGKNNATE